MKLTHCPYRASRRSGGSGGNCVEIAHTDGITVRDSKIPEIILRHLASTGWQHLHRSVR